MTHEDITGLGWYEALPRYNTESHKVYSFPGEHPYYEMDVIFHPAGSLFAEIRSNPTLHGWDKGKTIFYGRIQSKNELRRIMIYTGIIRKEEKPELDGPLKMYSKDSTEWAKEYIKTNSMVQFLLIRGCPVAAAVGSLLGEHVKLNYDFPLHDEVFKIVGECEDSIEVEGDFSAGTHNVKQTSWEKKELIREFIPVSYFKDSPVWGEIIKRFRETGYFVQQIKINTELDRARKWLYDHGRGHHNNFKDEKDIYHLVSILLEAYVKDSLRDCKNIIRFNPAEKQSGYDRQKWAEVLILQLPVKHDGRNSWLLNYGILEEAKRLREKRGIKWNEETRSAETIHIF